MNIRRPTSVVLGMGSSRIEDVEQARPWLFTGARRLVIDRGRHRPGQLMDTLLATVDEVSTSDELDVAPDACLVADALGALPPVHIPNGTVRSRMFHALRLALLERGVQQL